MRQMGLHLKKQLELYLTEQALFLLMGFLILVVLGHILFLIRTLSCLIGAGAILTFKYYNSKVL